MSQFSRQFMTADAQTANPDRWYYNAVLSNPSTGDTTEVVGRYIEQRTVPLLDDCSGYYVSLARMSVIGATASLPVLVPPVSAPPPAGTDMITTQYAVGLRWTFYDADTSSVLGYSELMTDYLQIPSLYPTSPRTDPQGKFYWVNSAKHIEQAINSSIQRLAAKQQVTGVAVPNSPWTISMPVGKVNTTAYPFADATMPYYVTLDKDTYRVTVHSPYPYKTNTLTAGDSNYNYVYTTGVTVSNFSPAPVVEGRLTLFFNDKLMEIMPIECYPATATRGVGEPSVSFTVGSLVLNGGGAYGTVTIPIPSGTWAVDDLMTYLTYQARTSVFNNGNPAPITPFKITYNSSAKTFTMTWALTAGTNSISWTSTGAGSVALSMGYTNTSGSATGTLTYTSASQIVDVGTANPWLYSTKPWYTSPQLSSTGQNYYPVLTEAEAADYVGPPSGSAYNPSTTVCQWEATFEQEFDNTSAWSPYTGLAITSNMIPAMEEALGINITPNNNAVQSAAATTNNIIFDLDLTQDMIHQIQTGIAFTPALFRYAKLKSAPLTGIDLNFYLRRKDGTYVPWNITNGGTINVKLMFCKTPY